MEPQELVQPTQSPPRHQLRCPICRRPLHVFAEATAQGSKSFPFCSERCKLLDLGAWLDGDYRIPARPDDPSDEAQTDDRPASD